jgi:hypothetical protein
MSLQLSSKVKKIILSALAIGVFIIFAGYLFLSYQIGQSVKQTSQNARQQFPGDRVEALMSVVKSEGSSLGEKNKAIWALGQLGDQRALPLLKDQRTGQPCQHGRLICQREVEKAIRHCERGFNITTWVWR